MRHFRPHSHFDGPGYRALAEEARSFLQKVRRVSSDDEVLQAGRLLFGLAACRDDADYPEEELALDELVLRLRQRLRRGRIPDPDDGLFLEVCRRHRLAPLEQEILLALVLGQLGLTPRVAGRSPDIEDLQQILVPTGRNALDILRALAPHRTLVRSGLVRLKAEETPVLSDLEPDPVLVYGLWTERRLDEGWPVETWEEFLDALEAVARAVTERTGSADLCPDPLPAGETLSLPGNLPPFLTIHLRAVEHTLMKHPDWPLWELFRGPGATFEMPGRKGEIRIPLGEPLTDQERMILLILMCRELGHLPAQRKDYYEGAALCRIVAGRGRNPLHLLRRRSSLRARGLIEPRGGPAFETENEHDGLLQELEWSLTEEARQLLRLPRRRATSTHRILQPKHGLDRVVLPPETRRRIEEILLQARNTRRLFDEWGLGETVLRHRGLGVLFAGPPGTGKTCAAEAVAQALGRDLLVVDYGALHSMWVGETEKNVSRVFREAEACEAVLFFDEADAVFFDRDGAVRSWEAREVNVLLQEIERFSGICILATNRDPVLDRALARRLEIRIAFQLPGLEERSQLWRLHLPAKLPVEDDLDLERLAAFELSGGQIRNAVLAAARSALLRAGEAGEARITQVDLEAAARRELEGSPGGPPLGFRPVAETRNRRRMRRPQGEGGGVSPRAEAAAPAGERIPGGSPEGSATPGGARPPRPGPGGPGQAPPGDAPGARPPRAALHRQDSDAAGDGPAASRGGEGEGPAPAEGPVPDREGGEPG